MDGSVSNYFFSETTTQMQLPKICGHSLVLSVQMYRDLKFIIYIASL